MTQIILEKDVQRFWSKVNKAEPDECWEWLASRNKKGYGHIYWDNRIQQAHRVAWIISHGEIDNTLLVLHTCDNPPCCNPSHLFQGTDQDNSDDMRSKGRGNWFSGENNKHHKLTDVQVAEICRRYVPGRNGSISTLAKEFGVNKSHIWRIVSGRSR